MMTMMNPRFWASFSKMEFREWFWWVVMREGMVAML
jgi:hypothetical protein